MYRACLHTAVSALIAILTGITGQRLSAQEIRFPVAPQNLPVEETSIPAVRSDSLLLRPADVDFSPGYSPLYLPVQEDPLEPAGHTAGAQGGSAGLLQPALDAACLSTCSISSSGGDSGHSPDGGSSGQNTAALVMGTMGAALSAVLISRMDKTPGWRSVDVFPHLAIGPAGGLYCGVQVAIHLR